MRHCRVCGRYGVKPLDYPVQFGGPWYRCVCGSDSSSNPFTGAYDEKWLASELSDGVDREADMRANLDWFPGKGTFLDVGAADGSALRDMKKRGWVATGWDVYPRPGCKTSEHFNASIGAFDAVLCREVIEHVETWFDFLIQLTRATKRGGHLQIQTPLPGVCHGIPYQSPHLQIFSAPMLRHYVEALGFETVEHREWGLGQALLARRV